MAFKVNISGKDGKTYHLDVEGDNLNGKELKQKVQGNEVSPDLEGYEFEISGASDKAGFPALEEVEGMNLRKILFSYGKGFKKRPKREGKKKRPKNRPKGLRLRKSVRGKVISDAISQINLKVLTEGKKKLPEVFPDQNKAPEPEQTAEQSQEAQTPAQ